MKKQLLIHAAHSGAALFAFALLLLVTPPLLAQSSGDRGAKTVAASNPDDGNDSITKIAVKVKVVNVLASVRDKHGELITNLTKDDFTLTEDGRPQTIRYFAAESDLPLTLGLLVDTSMSQRRVLDQERSASRSFVSRMVREDRDKAFVIHFDREVELLQDLTGSHEKLEAALDGLDTPTLNRPTGGGQNPNSGTGGNGGYGGGRSHGSGHGSGGGTLLYDSVYLASDEVIRNQQGRKALIILSDGVDNGSKESLDYAVETAQRSDAIVYAILFKDDEAYGGGSDHQGMGRGGWGGGGMGRHGGMGGPRYPQQQRPDGKKILERIAKETGGRMFEVSKKKTVEQIYAQIEDELRHQYNLGYTPERAGATGEGYHKIQLVAKKKDEVVQAREGYYGE